MANETGAGGYAAQGLGSVAWARVWLEIKKFVAG